MRPQDLKQETAIETIKATPAVAGAAYASLTLNEWVAIATLLYILLQVGVLIHKHWCFIKDRKHLTAGDVKDKIDEL